MEKEGIVYALTAIKGVGKPVIEALVAERKARGPFNNLQDLITRDEYGYVNKRVIESFIKAGAFDSLGGTRKQLMSVYLRILDHIHQNKKNNMAGQLTLFDLVGEEQKSEFDIPLPSVGEYTKEMMLSFEKEVLGIYVSGHPLEEYEELWKKHITNKTTDFLWDEETGSIKAAEASRVTVGGMIVDKKIKYTKNNQIMSFLGLEDLVGNMEIVVFPKVYEKYSSKLVEEGKVFVTGRVQADDERDGKIICESIMSFDEVPKKLWIKFPTKEVFLSLEKQVMEILKPWEGSDQVIFYIETPKAMKTLPPNQNVCATKELRKQLEELVGEENLRLV